MIGAVRKEIQVVGVSTEIFSKGSGTPLVFLHPGDGIEPSAPFIDALSEHYRVIAPSHPGFGGSALPPEFDSIADLAFFYLDFLDNLGEEVILVGASFGGWLAAEIATRNLAHISRLVMVGSLGIKCGDREQREITDIFSVPLAELPKLLSRSAKLPNFTAQREEETHRFARNRESLSLFGWSPTLYNPKLRQRLHRIKVSSLFLWGDDDRIVPASYGRTYAAALPSAQFELIADAGHYAHVDNPAEAVRRIVRFAGAPVHENAMTGVRV